MSEQDRPSVSRGWLSSQGYKWDSRASDGEDVNTALQALLAVVPKKPEIQDDGEDPLEGLKRSDS